jgi:hypothetical protein
MPKQHVGGDFKKGFVTETTGEEFVPNKIPNQFT